MAGRFYLPGVLSTVKTSVRLISVPSGATCATQTSLTGVVRGTMATISELLTKAVG